MMTSVKKCEVTFSEKVTEIKGDESASKENFNIQSTPFKNSSPSVHSLKSVKEHVKTPFSKIKDNSEEGNDSQGHMSGTKTNQPNFNTDILVSSAQKSTGKSLMKSASRSKSPLPKIKEEKLEGDEPSMSIPLTTTENVNVIGPSIEAETHIVTSSEIIPPMNTEGINQPQEEGTETTTIEINIQVTETITTTQSNNNVEFNQEDVPQNIEAPINTTGENDLTSQTEIKETPATENNMESATEI
jgi:hypothetical protein